MRASFALQSLFSQANSLEYNQIGQLKEVIITPDIQGMRICAKETHDVLFYHIHISSGKALLKSGQEFIFAYLHPVEFPYALLQMSPGFLINYAAKVVILPLMKKPKTANQTIHTMNPTFLRLNVKIRLFVGLCVLLRAM